MPSARLLSVGAALLSLGSAGQPDAPKPYAAPLRDLKLGQVNFLHTTDTHGWHAGHLLEASYAADWGDYIDFAERLREKVEAQGQDLLLVDTGDRIEGNGLYDASNPRGKYTFDIFKEQPIDFICSGNHELYKATSASDEYNITVPAYKDSYLASNLDIFVDGQYKPLAPRFKKFTTKKQGIRIMSFGFIYNFLRNDNNTRVQPVEQAIQESWFQEAIRDKDVDLFVVIGHSAVRSDEFNAIYKAIRTVKWDIPIQFFGGHYHIRDYRRYDSKAYGVASGRFMETIGFASVDGVKTKAMDMTTKASPSFFRRYIDNNLYSFYHHSATNGSTFHSSRGKKVSVLIHKSRSALKLDHTYGCAPKDLWMARAPYPANDSIFTWLNETVLPTLLPSSESEAQATTPRIILLNTGAIRFDIFKGAFTRDSTYIVSPFTSKMHYLPAIPYGKAKQLLAILNTAGQIFLQATDGEMNPDHLAPIEQRQRHVFSGTSLEKLAAELRAEHLGNTNQQPLSDGQSPALRPGYTTADDAGTDGDDTIHSEIAFYRVPNVIQSLVNPDFSKPLTDDTQVDVVFNEFIQPYLLQALRFVGMVKSDADCLSWGGDKSFTDLMAEWIGEHWEKNC